MRIFIGVAVGMMPAVKHGIRPRIQERRTLEDECHHIKRIFPERVHPKHPVRSVPVQKKRLREKR